LQLSHATKKRVAPIGEEWRTEEEVSVKNRERKFDKIKPAYASSFPQLGRGERKLGARKSDNSASKWEAFNSWIFAYR